MLGERDNTQSFVQELQFHVAFPSHFPKASKMGILAESSHPALVLWAELYSPKSKC